jgi:putative FmdB family regulatory protein
MPIYEYECTKCKEHLEIMQKITEDPLSECPTCGGNIKRLISNTSFILKGTGWYATDYASNRGNGERSKDPSPAKTEKSKETKTNGKKETKTETKAETKETVSTKQ